MILLFRRAITRKQGRGRYSYMYTLKQSREEARHDLTPDLGQHINTAAIKTAMAKMGMRDGHYGTGIFWEPQERTTRDPDGLTKQLDALVLQHCGLPAGQLVLVYDAYADRKFDARVASHLLLEMSYANYFWYFRVRGWEGDLGSVIFLNNARKALHKAGLEVDYREGYSNGLYYTIAVKPPAAQYWREGSPQHIEQGTAIGRVILPFLRIYPGGQTGLVHSAGLVRQQQEYAAFAQWKADNPL